jgi:hypothetical protein
LIADFSSKDNLETLPLLASSATEDSMKKIFLILFFIFFTFENTNVNAQQTQPAPGIDPKADELLRKMSDLLSTSKTFTFRAFEEQEKFDSKGEKITIRLSREAIVKRPNGFWERATGTENEKPTDCGSSADSLYCRIGPHLS